jgi:hypothetical protein
MSCCPTCGRPYPPKLEVGGTLRQRMVDLLLRRPDGVPIDELVELIYACEPDGSPMWAHNSIWVIAHEANKKLRAFGYQIVSTKGRGSRYRMVKLNARSIRQRTGDRHARAVERTEPAVAEGIDR